MKRAGNLFEAVYSFENLLAAFKKAFRGSGKTTDACLFYFNCERELLKLQDEIKCGDYLPSKYRYFKIFEPKERTISVATFRERVVHHAVVRVMEPVFEKRFIYDSYATRKKKGTHRAVKRAQYFLRHKCYYLKFDINKYFDHIDHIILIELIERKIKDPELIKLLRVITANSDLSKGKKTGVGLPIGNLTSQFFANIYLDPLDHYIKEILRMKYYLRYMDDCVVFYNNKTYLKTILVLLENFLFKRLKLKLKPAATFLNTRSNGLPFLGYRVFPSLIRIKSENIKRLKAKIRLRESQYKNGVISEEKYSMSLSSLIGYAKFADSLQLRRRLFT